jgi:uncharacterized membrane protein YjjB (DUF3815 family)
MRAARALRLCRRLWDLTALTTACVGTVAAVLIGHVAATVVAAVLIGTVGKFVGRIDKLAERDPAGIE